jgi:NAD(P)H dehydrogenase (quinone)
MILITGATGKTGGEVTRQLLAKGTPVRVFVRDPSKLSDDLAQAELATGDLADKAAVEAAVEGITKAVLVVSNGEQQFELESQFTDCAAAAGVEHLLYLSSMESTPGTTNAITSMHVAAEDHIRASGMHWTMIRPTFFMQNLLGSARTMKEKDIISLPVGAGKIAATDMRDAASVMAAVLTSNAAHWDQSYDLTGPELMTMDEVAATFSNVLGREIRYVEQPLEEFRTYLSQFLPPWRVNAVCEEFEAIANGSVDHTTDNVSSILGREATSVGQFIRDHLAIFQS